MDKLVFFLCFVVNFVGGGGVSFEVVYLGWFVGLSVFT